jgi:hypothetical protein
VCSDLALEITLSSTTSSHVQHDYTVQLHLDFMHSAVPAEKLRTYALLQLLLLMCQCVHDVRWPLLAQTHSRTVVAAEDSLIAVLTADTVAALKAAAAASSSAATTATTHSTTAAAGIDATAAALSQTASDSNATTAGTSDIADTTQTTAAAAAAAAVAAWQQEHNSHSAALLLSVLQAIALRTAYTRSQELSLFSAGALSPQRPASLSGNGGSSSSRRSSRVQI